MRPYKWRKINAGYRYVDSMTGSDLQGDGTQLSPFRTLRRAWGATATKPLNIVCRGFFSEDMADGNHNATIMGDYFGAATFDGNDAFLIYGFTHNDLVITNCVVGDVGTNVANGSGLFAGVGCASSNSFLGNTSYVYGVDGSPAVLDRTGVYLGVIGGRTTVQYNVFSKIRSNSTYKVSLGIRLAGTLGNNTFYSVKKINRVKRITNTGGTFSASIFADFDLFVDDSDIIFDTCLFTSDCQFYFGSTEIVLTGTNSVDRLASLIAGMDALSIPALNRSIFTNCVFTTETAFDVFNNPEKLDFTLKLNGAGVRGAGLYFGALPPAINIPILDDSTQTPATWDENSVSGCLAVANDNICIDELSADFSGKILSKVLIINPTEININAVFAQFSAKFPTYRAYLLDEVLTGIEYTDADILPIGRYIVKGSIVYYSQNIGDNSICQVTVAGTSFVDVNTNTVLIALDDANISNVCYIRESPLMYAKIEAGDGLEAGATYLNANVENITYRSRTIVPHESFVAENSVDTFTGSAGYKIGVLFDDTRVPSQPWIPAQIFGEYFVWKNNGVVQYDTIGVPISSGNYLSYQTTANGGYSNTLLKSIINKVYIQVKVEIKRYRND